MMKKVLLDTNVIIDWLAKRVPFAERSIQVIELVRDGKVAAFVSASAITDIFYIIRKLVNLSAAQDAITQILSILKIAAIDESDIIAARYSLFADFEDAVQFTCAKKLGADYIITRDTADFEQSTIPAISPDDFIITHKDL
jgi:predicted nucleic acid-binding protein